MSKTFEATHHIAIDGSQRGSAIAIVRAGEKLSAANVYKVGGVELIGSFEPLEQLARGICDTCHLTHVECEAQRQAHGFSCCSSCGHVDDAAISPCRPLVMIERPGWTGHGTREVASAVSAWERQLQRLFPSRHVMRVDPNVWQRLIFGEAKSRPCLTTKENSLFYCRHVLHRDIGDDHDQADALCILAYLRNQLRLRA